MHTTTYEHSGHTVCINHNSDWSGDAEVTVMTPDGEVLKRTLPGHAILGLALAIAEAPFQCAFEDAVDKLKTKARG